MKEDSCGCSSMCPSRDTSCFFLLGLIITLYMLVGAAIFSALERPGELKAHLRWEERLEGFRRDHSLSPEDLRALLTDYEEAYAAGIRMDTRRARWDFPGSFYFVGTVVSTIGFGMTAPSTTLGKVILVIYGLIGCSATILFFNLFLERVITMLGAIMRRCHDTQTRSYVAGRGGVTQQHDAVGGESRGLEEDMNIWRPPVYYVTLILFVAALVLACGAAILYSAMEGWGYFESLYFCFVAFSTVGFGDLVSGQREHHEDERGYHLANALLMLLGVCCTYSLFNAVSVIIKQGLNWTLGQLVRLRSCVCPSSPQQHSPRQSVLLCCCDPSRLCRCGDLSQPRHRPQTPHADSWQTDRQTDMGKPVFLPPAVGKCLCAAAAVETVYRGDGGVGAGRRLTGQYKLTLPGESVVYLSPPPS